MGRECGTAVNAEPFNSPGNGWEVSTPVARKMLRSYVIDPGADPIEHSGGNPLLTFEIMQRRWPNGDQHIPGLIEGIVAAAPIVFSKYGLLSPRVAAHAMAQFSEECGQGLEMIENMNYSTEGLLKVFPKHFTPAMAERWAHNPEVIGEIAYGGRMGNSPPPSTDGYVFRGSGLCQVTGRDGVSKLQDFLKKNGADFDILQNPELIIDPTHALECGVADWVLCGCLPFAEKDDIVGETKALNGGLNGLPERQRQLALWKSEGLT
jgi:putative chitinase